ncbi:pilus assembly protein [Stenotrophomonas chelatiphaga]|jgi:type IV pilus assembly protein PilX|uniref:Pilus assembly protein n=1 Tax=Stenotrophomonas chelatiphaga TaxID=517011 RepID=A0A0R0D699_9GAMM|nr:PilX N-terminal domain-containing pilus assembly protein [Stenotrophomonas chelatiphaga]KRG73364.1 pilus assembly protein [Stenotrophomonas chelatiphaga]MCS4230270.1 type IV pilus assembly protein PilX [Stenotrophomonas chelatiphaga]ROQ43630.1 type IV pilus assembly protein PilX [Stenotrophomonas maltophilia]
MHRIHIPRTALPSRQRGAVLYVALIMLILLSLLGIAGMQVANMQERMASNYRAVNAAFQRSEDAVRLTENQVEALANRDATAGATGSLTSASIEIQCDNGYDPSVWTSQRAQSERQVVKVRQIETCIQGEAALGMGRPVEAATPVYQITAYATDTATSGDPSRSAVAIDTVFKL